MALPENVTGEVAYACPCTGAPSTIDGGGSIREKVTAAVDDE